MKLRTTAHESDFVHRPNTCRAPVMGRPLRLDRIDEHRDRGVPRALPDSVVGQDFHRPPAMFRISSAAASTLSPCPISH